MNETEIFLKACKKYNVELKLVDGAIAVLGDSKHAQNARRSLDSSKELTAGVIELLRERAAQEQAQGQPDAQVFKPEAAVSETGELESVTACKKALNDLTDAQKFKLRNFLTACERRGLYVFWEQMSNGRQRVILEQLNGEPVAGDISDLFTWIYGWSECALLVYLGSQYGYMANGLELAAKAYNCDAFTAAYVVSGIRRDLYLETCKDWNFKPEHIPPELEEPIKFKPVPSDTTLRIFEVENQRGERFKFQTSCNDKYLPDALKGLRVISELTYRPTASASSHTGDKSD
ncbi:MAG: hypothetical protein IJQ29_04445 [Synergistaceae bacterium]|nr:hypothetical protein [Synergistaceae bacterium]